MTAAFSEAHLGITPRFTGNRTYEAIHAVQSGEADLGIIPKVHLPKDLLSTPVFKTSFVLITAKDNPFKISSRPDWPKISRLPMLSFVKQGTIYKLLQETIHKAGVTLNIIQYQQHFSTIKQLVAMGQGVTVVDKEAVDRDDLLQIPLQHLLKPRPWVIMSSRERSLRPSMLQFYQWITGSSPP